MSASEYPKLETIARNAGEAEVTGHYSMVAYVFVGFLTFYVIVRGLVGAAAKPLWFDELLTLTVSGQPTIRRMWDAVARGFDSGTPPFYLVERCVLGLIKNQEIALRFPSIVAFVFCLICLFIYVKRRAGEAVAGLCVLLLLSTSLFVTYMIEARAYSMLIACIAFALVCYQRLPSRAWTAMFAVSLVVAGSLHYYAIFAMVPFWLAESVLSLQTRRIRWFVWISLIVGTVPLIVFWPLLTAIRANYAYHFSPPGFLSLPEYFGSYFLVDTPSGVALAGVAVLAIFWKPIRPITNVADCDPGTERPESVLLLGLVGLPFLIFVAMRIMHGVELSRYGLAAILGIIIGIAILLRLARPRAIAILTVFALVSFVIREVRFWRQSAHESSLVSPIEQIVNKSGYEHLPIVVCDGLLYFQLAHYSREPLSKRIFYLTDESKEMRYEGSDMMVRVMEGVRDFAPVQAEDYSSFVAQHPEFLIYTQGWLFEYLVQEGWSVRVVAANGGDRLYLAKRETNCEQGLAQCP